MNTNPMLTENTHATLLNTHVAKHKGELQFTRASTIEFHNISSNVISLGERDIPTKDLLHTKGVWKTLVSR